VETIPTEFKTVVDYSKAFYNLILLEIWDNICSAMDDISSGMYVEVSENRSVSGFTINLPVAKGKDCPNRGDIMLLSSRESKSRDQILKEGLCTIIVVKKTSFLYEQSDNSKRCCMIASRSKLPHGGNPKEGLHQVMHMENLNTYECCWNVMMNGFKCSSTLINLILSKNNIGVSTSLSLYK
jgi:hypothetical protein